MKWNSVKNKLPKDWQKVILLLDGVVALKIYEYNPNKNIWESCIDNDWENLFDYDYWMPLPCPPREE